MICFIIRAMRRAISCPRCSEAVQQIEIDIPESTFAVRIAALSKGQPSSEDQMD